MSGAKRGLSLLISKGVRSSKIRNCVQLSHKRFNSNESDSIKNDTKDHTTADIMPTRYTLTNAAKSLSHQQVRTPLDQTEVLSSVLDNPKCYTCGIKLQKENPKEPGFYRVPEYKRPQRKDKKKQLEFYRAYSRLDETAKKMLEESMGSTDIQTRKQRKLELKRTGKNYDDGDMSEEHLKCVRCYDALYHSTFSIPENRANNYKEIMDKIPPNSHIYHVASSHDFPLGLMNHPNRNKRTTYIINKMDVLFPSEKSSMKYGWEYFETVLKRLVKAKELHLVSANRQWGLEKLLETMPAISYMVGFVNSGKTFLTKQLKSRAQLEDMSMAKKIRKDVLQKVTGATYIPAFTREFIENNLIEKKTYDTPGFFPEKTTFDIIRPEFLKGAMKCDPFYAAKVFEAKYVSVHGGQCYTLGGLIYLLPPEGTLLQVVSGAKGTARVFKSLERAVELARDPPTAVKGMVVKPEALDNLVRYVIPPFLGKIDLVMKDFGYIQIKPVGKKVETELFEVWAPEGLIVGVRRAMADFITKCQPYDKDGKPMRKGDKTRPASVETKRIPQNEKLFTQLYRIPHDCKDPMTEMKSQHKNYLAEDGEGLLDGEDTGFSKKSDTKYWIEKI